MEKVEPNLNERIAGRVRELRAAGGLALDALAARCGVSRSMISLIERGESSPTAVVLEKIATGLGVPLASLFDPPSNQAGPASLAEPVARRADQPLWRDPSSGYVRRNVSPSGAQSPLQIVEVEFPVGARVAYDTGARSPRVHQQIWVLAGRIDIALGAASYRLEAGDCFAMVLDQPMAYHNPGPAPALYAVVIATEPFTKGFS
ncbi:MAG: transcriptional regulator, family [Rhodoferax sp.]|nr:transcriptional regulator, family [Rhodoferax sp.]